MGQSVFSRQPVDLLISGIWRKKLKKDTFWGDGFVLFFQKSQNGFKLITSGGLWFWKFHNILRFQQGYVHFAGVP